MASPFTAGLADVTVTSEGEVISFSGVKVLVRPEDGTARGRLTSQQNVPLGGMEVASVVALGGRRYRILGVDGEEWLVTTRCGPCGR